MGSIAPQTGATVEYVSEFPHVGTVIHSVLSLILAYVQRKYQGLQVPHIVPYLGRLIRSTQYHYNELES